MPFAKRRDVEEHGPGYRPVVYTPREADWIETLPGEKLLFRVRSTEVGGSYAVLETIAAPNSGSPAHFHAEDEVFQVLSGTMTFMVAGEIFSAPEGTTVVVPAGTPHAWKNRSSGPVRMLATFTPGGVEAMFEQLAGLPPEKVVEVAAGFGTVVVGPPLD